MKLYDFIYRYKTDAIVNKAGICRVRLFIHLGNQCFYAVISQLDENPSTSVTNAIETIVSSLIAAEKIPVASVIVDHYPQHDFGYPDEFHIVSFDQDGIPSWSAISMTEALSLFDCEEDEFINYRTNKRLQKEIYDAIKGVPKIQQYEYIEAPEITERRLEILAGQYSFDEVRRFLDTKPSEAKLAAFIKRDMSLLAESFAFSDDEYICFSEFPVGDGRVDFAIFTGRSRMTVFLIEIKGAHKTLCRKNHYGAFKADIQEGLNQLLKRADWCCTNYERFRTFSYAVLKEVENGKRPYHAFVGPQYHLAVDPNKDINLVYALIAGRTGDDIADSHKRHITETSSSLTLKTETWDSWLKS